MLHAELKVVEGKQRGKSVPLNVKKFLIGREEDCQLRPNTDLVSRHHCVFNVDDFTVRLRDLGSTNGTYVNGERIQGQVVLKEGDVIQVGKLTFELVLRQPVPHAVAAVPAAPDSVLADDEPETSAESDSKILAASETVTNISETQEFTPAQLAPFDGDTAVIPGGTGGHPEAPVPPPFYYAPGQPAYPYAAQPGYPIPGQPVYPMPGQPVYGAPGQPVYGAPGQPGYPAPGQPMYPMPGQPMYPVPGQPMYPVPGQPVYGAPGQPVYAAPPAAPPSSTRIVAPPPLNLPPPEETGAKEVPPPAPPAPASTDPAAPTAEVAKNPSHAAADIIRMHMQRRPK